MGWWLLLAVFLYIVCAALIVAEVFLPSGGILSVCALACVVGGIAIWFHYSTLAGWLGIGVAVVMIPLLLVATYKMLPKTRFGQQVLLAGPKRERGDAIVDTPELVKLIGQIGTVVTPLRPVGMCNFDGRRIECVAESGFVTKDSKVTVIRVEGTQVTVRVINEA